MIGLLFLACKPAEDSAPVEEQESTPPPPEVVVSANPTSIDFGALGLTEAAEQVVSLTNGGEGQISLTAVSESEDDLSAMGAFGVMVDPGSSADVTLTWTPLETSGLSTTVTFLFSGEGGKTGQVALPVSGQVSAPELSVSTTSIEFGTVGVGCDKTETFTVSNTGNEAMELSSIGVLDGIEEYWVSAASGELTFPLTLEAGASQEFQVHYLPTDDATLAAVVQIASNDPVTPDALIQLDGTGHIDGEDELTWQVKPKNVTVVMALNAVAVFGGNVTDYLPGFFDTLAASRADYRVTLITEMTGQVAGDTKYIDNSYTTDEAMDVVDDMLANTGGDNDYLLDTFDKAIAENVDWLIDEGDEWADSTLSLIAMNSDQEQSTGSYVGYVNDYYAYKTDPIDIQVDALSGETPRGCNADGKYAEPADLLEQASTATGGTFVSWCSDWDEAMVTLANACLSGQQRFELTGNPADWSIHVYVDEVEQHEGWTYDATTIEVVFDDDHFPSEGSEVRVKYLMASDCSDV